MNLDGWAGTELVNMLFYQGKVIHLASKGESL